MLKNDECSSSYIVERKNDFTNSVAFNIAAWCGVFYFIFFPLFFIYCVLAFGLAIFHGILLPFDNSLFNIISYIVMGIYVLFWTSLCIGEPIEKLKYKPLTKWIMIFCFVGFHIISICIFVWSSNNL